MCNFLPLQVNSGEISSISTSLALVIPSSSTGSIKSNVDESLTVSTLSQDILINSPHSIVIQQQIQVDLRAVEFKLAELEYFLVTKCSDCA